MREFLQGVVDFWAAAVFGRCPEAFNRVIVTQSYYSGHVAGAFSFLGSLFATAVGLGLLAHYLDG